MGKVWDLDLGHAEQTVLLALADHADHDGGSVFPSLGFIGWRLGYSKRQVRRIVAKLRDELHLIEQVASSRDHRATEYRLTLENGVPKPPYVPDREDKLSGRTFRPDRADISTDRADTATSSEPSIEPPGEPSKGETGFDEWIEHHVTVTGNKAMSAPGTKARAEVEAAFRERRREYPDEDLRLVSIGAMADEHRRENGYTDAESVLRPKAVAKLLERGRRARPSQSDWHGDALLERTRRQYPPQREDAPNDDSHEQPPGGPSAAPAASDPGRVDDAHGDAGERRDRPAPS